MECRIAVGSDRSGWSSRFRAAIQARAGDGLRMSSVPADLMRDDWLDALRDCDAVIWKPPAMGSVASGFMKERIYHIEKILGLVVVPDCSTVWHFESKVAQEGLFRTACIPHPGTFASLDLDESLEEATRTDLPVVWKKSSGAAGRNVRLVGSRRRLTGLIRSSFWQSAWERARDRHGSPASAALHSIGRPWFLRKLASLLTGSRQYGAAYWQEFVPGNRSDLRINVIGDIFCTGFWRRNRPGDFRASGSGLLDYQTPVPTEALQMCLELNGRLGFDTMAYDILQAEGRMLVSEISYGYLDRAVYDVPGVWVPESDGNLRYVPGNRWPQDMWVDWLIEKCRRAGLL